MGPASPGIGNGLPADWGDELDGEGFLLGVDVSVICWDGESESPCRLGQALPRPTLKCCLPLSMASNSFSSPVMRGMRVQGVLVLVATAYTWGGRGCHMPEARLRSCLGNVGEGQTLDSTW